MADQKTIASIDAEQALLGALLFDGGILDRVETLVVADDFSESVHGLIFRAICEARRKDRQSGPLVVDAQLSSDPGYREVGGKDYLQKLAQNVPSTVGAPDYAQIISDYAKRRLIVQMAEETAMRARAGAFGDTPQAILDDAEAAISGMISGDANTEDRTTALGAGSDVWIKEIEAADNTIIGPTSGLRELDTKLGGLKPGSLFILAGRPSQGKTALALNFARSVCVQGYGVHFSSLEMPRKDLWRRTVADFAREHTAVPYTILGRERLNETESRAIGMGCDGALAMPLIVDDRAGVNAGQIIASVRRSRRRLQAQGVKLGLVIVDYIQLVAIERKLANNLSYAIGQISAALKQLAKDMDCTVLALSQLNRQVEARDDKRPNMADLRQSGEIEQDADVVAFVLRPEHYIEKEKPEGETGQDRVVEWQQRLSKARNKMKLFVDKHRNGPTGTIDLHCDIKCNAVRDKDYAYGSAKILEVA
ncbi:MAG: DnaB-like helicase C-terminal domain-containing protein [Pseudomonadota bacterium]